MILHRERSNNLLRRQRELRGWSQKKVADLLQSLGGGCDSKQISRWENGAAKPSRFYQELLISLFEVTADKLGFIKADTIVVDPYEETGIIEATDLLEGNPFESPCIDLEFRIQCIIYEALSQQTTLHELRRKLTSILSEERSIITMDSERRKLLRHLALLPIQAFGLNIVGGPSSHSTAPKDILIHCSAGVTACEQLSKGTDLHLAYTATLNYIPTLKNIARYNPSHRREASELIAQAMLLLAALSLHVESSKSAIGYAQQAVSYSEASSNLELTLTSLGQLAWIFSSDKQYRKALEKAQLAEYSMKQAKNIHPLVISNTYAVLGAYSAQNGHREEALVALDRATQTFFSTATDEDLNYMDYDYPEILLTWGLAHARTQHPEDALKSFSQVIDPVTLTPKMPVSERVRVEFLNNMTLASMKITSRDMGQTIRYWQAGVEGAKILQSEQRFNEALTATEVMESIWPGEHKIINLREQAIHW
jgi:transcriptional regulator with XRE-family HTH domain